MCMNAVSTESTILEYAVVVNIESNTVYVELNEQLIAATLSVSCLMQPEVEDKVLVSVDDENRCYVISILERVSKENKIIIDGDTHLQITNGSLHLIADDHLNMVAGDELNVTGNKANLAALDINISSENMTFLGKIFSAKLKVIKTVAESVDGFFKRVIHRTEDSYRYVENHDEVQAGSVRFLVDGTMSMQTESTHITAEEHVKVDSEQIHLG